MNKDWSHERRINMNRVCFIFRTPPMCNDDKKFLLHKIAEKKIEIDVVDISVVNNEGINELITQKRLDVPYINVITIKEKIELDRYIYDNYKNTFFFPMFDDYYEVRWVYKLFSKYHVKYGYVNNLVADFDVGIVNNSVNLRRMSLKHLFKAFYNRVGRKMLPYKNAEFICLGTDTAEQTFLKRGRCGKETKKVYTHTLDYERYCDAKQYDNGGLQYCVFIDQYIPYHPDNILDNGIRVNPDEYYRELNEIFNLIKQKFGYEVIIAAHPRSDYSNKKCFDGIKIEYGKTPELIKGAKMVLGHFSTSLCLTSMTNAPMVIICPKSFDVSVFFIKLCKAFIDLLGGKLVKSVDDINDIGLEIDSKKYMKFRNKYLLCDNQNNGSIWDEAMEIITNNH